ncbi:hypothetical protein [Roseivirga thermotolerans]|uniref:hypothetical protein n=1 Tax=Roseivirga thermotolerans TaxID=1758176 RepID=UPI00273DF851|nr:hypothetical protein [Roseivirga thermotolerans]
MRNIKSLLAALVLFSFGCTSSKTIIGTYKPNNSSWSMSALIIEDSSRFIWSESYEGFPTRTSGIYKLENDKLSLYSDKKPHRFSTIQYLSQVNNEDSLYVQVVFKNLVGETVHVPASVDVFYGNGAKRSFQCDNDGRVDIAGNEAESIMVKWIAGLPIEVQVSDFEPNNLRIVLVEDSSGNTRFNGKLFTVKGNKLIEMEGNRVFKKN